jgi:ribose-phosphate pyrophosphokinase
MERMILLADPNSKAWDFAKRIQKYILEEKEKFVRLEEVSIDHFRNQEISIHIPENVRKKEVYFIHDSTKNPQEWWIELLLLKDLLLSASAESVSLVLPDMLYSRQDRKDKPHVPISARALAKSLSTGIKRIITMDLHAPQLQGFYPENIPLDNLYSFTIFAKYLNETKNEIENLKELVILSPDAGGVDRAKSFAQRLESKYPVAFIEKRRVKAGEIESMRLAGDVDGKNVLIVDDIIDSGVTLCKAVELLKENGAKKLFCYGTHGSFTLGTQNLRDSFERVMTSNTHNQEREGIESIDVSPVFAEAIYRAQVGESISSLFTLESSNNS